MILTEAISHSYKKFKVEVEKVVGEVHIGDGNKAMTAPSVIAGLVGSQRVIVGVPTDSHRDGCCSCIDGIFEGSSQTWLYGEKTKNPYFQM